MSERTTFGPKFYTDVGRDPNKWVAALRVRLGTDVATDEVLRDFFEAALSTAPGGDGVPGWQQIGSAPKDGTWVLVRLSNGEVFRASWHVYGSPGWHVSSDIGFVNARHWMPLPVAPLSTASTAGKG